MKKILFRNWHFSRILRLLLGLSGLAAYFSDGDTVFLLFGILLSFQGIFDAGCGLGGCTAANTNHKAQNNLSETEYQEIS